MQIDPKHLAELEERIVNAKRIVVIPHKSPDGDALGAALALHNTLARLGKEIVPACVDPVPASFRFLPGSERFVDATQLDPAAYDLVICVDSGDLRQTGLTEKLPTIFEAPRFVIKIDHHPYAADFGDLKFVFTDTCASCYIVTHLLDALGVKIRPDVATCLLNGIYTDTGSFMHSNTTPDVLRTASRLMKAGANLAAISKSVFHTTPLSTMKLWGKVLHNLKQTKDGVTVAVAKQDAFAESGAKYEELAGIVDWLNAVPNAKFSMLLSERDGQVKGSLRTLRNDVNVAKIAAAFGGGGHVMAAGFSVPGKLEEELRWSLIEPDPKES